MFQPSSSADRHEQPLKPDIFAAIRTVGITLTALSFSRTFINPVGTQRNSAPSSFGVLSTYPGTFCGIATFSAALTNGLAANGADVSVVRLADGEPSSDPRVVGELVKG